MNKKDTFVIAVLFRDNLGTGGLHQFKIFVLYMAVACIVVTMAVVLIVVMSVQFYQPKPSVNFIFHHFCCNRMSHLSVCT